MAQNQTEKVLNRLKQGPLSPFAARVFYGVQNLRARIYDLRRQGVCVYTNRDKGFTQYRLGKPSKKVVATAHRTYGAKLFR